MLQRKWIILSPPNSWHTGQEPKRGLENIRLVIPGNICGGRMKKYSKLSFKVTAYMHKGPYFKNTKLQLFSREKKSRMIVFLGLAMTVSTRHKVP